MTTANLLIPLIQQINMKIEIKLDQKKCIGYGSCESLDPLHFKVEKKKATLLSGGREGMTHSLESDISGPALQHVTAAAAKCPVNAITVINKKNNKEIVGEKLETNGIREVVAEYDDKKEFILDPLGYFLIKIDTKRKLVEVGFCNEKNKMVLKVTGKTPLEIYQTIINKEKLGIRKDHAAYLGRELQKAYTALKFGLQYVQDDELSLDKKYK